MRDKWIGENLAFGTVCRVGRRFPSLAPKVAKLVTSAAAERELIDRSDRIFCSPRHVHFLEMEYGIPFDAVPDAIGRINDLVSTLAFPPLFPIEVRASAADDSPAVHRQRPSVGLDRHPPVRRSAVRGLLPGCRADHERLRRPAALGQAALPVVAHASPRVIPNGRRSATGAASSTPRARSATRISTGCSARRSRRDPGRVAVRRVRRTDGSSRPEDPPPHHPLRSTSPR